MAKITAKLFMAAAMGFFELLICEGCKNLLFGAGQWNQKAGAAKILPSLRSRD